MSYNNNNNDNRTLDSVLVVGGGLAGLSAALALLRLGSCQKVTVLEAGSEAEFHDESQGAAIQLTPNGFTALQLLAGEESSLVQRILQNSSSISQNAMVLPSQKQPFDNLQMLPKDPPSQFPTAMIRWGILRKLLAEELPVGTVQFNQKVTGYQRVNGTESHPKICLEIVDQKQQRQYVTEPVSLVIAADGKSSAFRPTKLELSNRINVKAVIPQQAPLPQADSTTYSIFCPPSLACFLGPTGNNWTYWAISMVVNAEETFYLNASKSDLQKKLVQDLQNTGQAELQVYADLIAATDTEAIYVQQSDQAELPPTMSAEDGTLVLVGDAGHAMSGSYGQAASFAFEDATTLAYSLAQESSQDGALQQYSSFRRDRCLLMQEKSQERATKAMKGQDCSDITSWIHDWNIKIETNENEVDEPMTVVG